MLLLQLIILLIIIFGVLIFVLRHVLTTNISSATSHLDVLNSEFSKREEDAKKRQLEADKYYDEMMAKTKDDLAKLQQEADNKLRQEQEKSLADAHAQSEEIILKAQKSKDMIVNELRHEMHAKLLGDLRELIVTIFPGQIAQEIHNLWLNNLLATDLTKLSLMRISSDIKEAKITTAFPLTEAQRGSLHKIIKEQLNRDLSFVENIDESLIGGIVVIFGSLVLDGTISHRLEEAIASHDKA